MSETEPASPSPQDNPVVVAAAQEQVVEILEQLPAHERRVVEERILSMSSSFQGPIPSPEMLAQYERALPGLPSTLIASWREESAHRRDMEKEELALRREALRAEVDIAKGGQRSAFILVSALILGAFILGALGHVWLAGVALTSTVVAVLTVFVLRKHPGRQDNQSPRAESEPESSD